MPRAPHPHIHHSRRLLAVLSLALGLAAGLPAVAQASVTVSDAQVGERDGVATFVVTRQAGLLAPPIQIAYLALDITAKAPGDYIATQGTLNFPISLLGETQTATFTVPIVDDEIAEETEHFQVRITGNEVVNPTGLGTIIDNDPASPPGRLTSTKLIRQQLIARAADGGRPNAPATEPVMSWDARTARYVAYTSAATNITGATDGRRNVFVVKRGGSPGKYGTPWEYGTTILASAGAGGAPANGDSWSPTLDGWTKGDDAHKPTCVAFVSDASNLVAGDTNNQADVFVRRLRGNGLRRIASPPGQPASEVGVAGDCRTIGMVAGGSLYTSRAARRLHKVVGGGGVSAPDLTFNGEQVSYSRGGSVFTRRLRGRSRLVAAGSNPVSDGGRPAGKIRKVAYERDGHTYWSTVGGRERPIGAGRLPAMSAGGTQVMFANGPFVFIYAVSNDFGKKLPQGYCPAGQGTINSLSTSARGNYLVFSCAGGEAYLTYIGPK